MCSGRSSFRSLSVRSKLQRSGATRCAGFKRLGLAVGVYLLFFIVTGPVVPEIVGQHIVYLSPHFFIKPVIPLYVTATCLTGVFSSHPLKLFGALTLLSFSATYLFYAHALVSVWCFFAAILSVLICLHLRFRILGGFTGQVQQSMYFALGSSRDHAAGMKSELAAARRRTLPLSFFAQRRASFR